MRETYGSEVRLGGDGMVATRKGLLLSCSVFGFKYSLCRRLGTAISDFHFRRRKCSTFSGEIEVLQFLLRLNAKT